MYRLEVTLKQHTPLIHFQHDQEGATLRASEVKPKLDRFILTKLGSSPTNEEEGVGLEEAKKEAVVFHGLTPYEKGKYIAKGMNWLVGNGTKPALNYKMRITPDPSSEVKHISIGRFPLFFANMRGEEKYKFSLCEKLQMSCQTSYGKLIDLLKRNLSDFFLETNFGTRQSKGFGSFYPEESGLEDFYKKPVSNLFFMVDSNNYKTVFNYIDLFYRSIRGGINVKNSMSDQFYFKSLLFLYGRSMGIQWEKRKIKEQFFLYDYEYRRKDFKSIPVAGLRTQEEKRRNTYNKNETPLFYKAEKVRLLKDLLGLSTFESWASYGTSITKTEAKKDENRGFYTKKNESEISIARMQSPILFKPIRNKNNGYDVFILINESVREAMRRNVLGKTFIIESKVNGQNKKFDIGFPTEDEFSLDGFFKYILDNNNFDIRKHVDPQFQKRETRDRDGRIVETEFAILEKIYSQLMKNYYE